MKPPAENLQSSAALSALRRGTRRVHDIIYLGGSARKSLALRTFSKVNEFDSCPWTRDSRDCLADSMLNLQSRNCFKSKLFDHGVIGSAQVF